MRLRAEQGSGEAEAGWREEGSQTDGRMIGSFGWGAGIGMWIGGTSLTDVEQEMQRRSGA